MRSRLARIAVAWPAVPHVGVARGVLHGGVHGRQLVADRKLRHRQLFHVGAGQTGHSVPCNTFAVTEPSRN